LVELDIDGLWEEYGVASERVPDDRRGLELSEAQQVSANTQNLQTVQEGNMRH
jgi:hypothetical protein